MPAPLLSGGTALEGVSGHGCPSPSLGSARARPAPGMAADSHTCSRGLCKFNQIRNSLSERRWLESVTVIVLVPAVPWPRLATLFLESGGGTVGWAWQDGHGNAGAGGSLGTQSPPPGPSGEQAERTEGPGGSEGAGRGPGEGKRSSAKAGGQMAQERAELRQQKVFTAAADSKGERGTGLRQGGEGRRGRLRSPDHSLPQASMHAPIQTQPSMCAPMHTQPRAHPAPRTPTPVSRSCPRSRAGAPAAVGPRTSLPAGHQTRASLCTRPRVLIRAPAAHAECPN